MYEPIATNLFYRPLQLHALSLCIKTASADIIISKEWWAGFSSREKTRSCPWKCSTGTKIQQSRCSSVSKDWVVISSRKDSQLSSKCSAGKTIQLILVDDSNGHERHSLDVGISHLIVLSRCDPIIMLRRRTFIPGH
jgi:hypothetical protein